MADNINENVPSWQFNVIPGNANQGAILITKNSIGLPPFNQSDFKWAAMEDVIGVAAIKIVPTLTTYEFYTAKGHMDNEGDWTYQWSKIGEIERGGGGGGGVTPGQLQEAITALQTLLQGEIDANADDISNINDAIADLQSEKQDILTPGDGIVIENDSISVNAGTGIKLATQGGSVNKSVQIDGTIETWTFTLSDDSTVTKKIAIMN